MNTQRILLWILIAVLSVGPGIAAQQPPTPPAAVNLADLLREAEQKHPAIRAVARMVEAKRARVPQAKSLPDPTATVGWMGNIAPFDVQRGDPSSYRGISAMEEFPYPGKLRLRGEIASKDVSAEQWTLEAVRRQIRREVEIAYFELWSVEKALDITQKDKDLLEKFERIAEEKYKVGKGLQQDVLRAQVEVSRVLQRLTILQQRQRTFQAEINSLLLRPPDSPLGPLAPVEKSLLNYSLEELLSHAEASAPEIRRQQELIEQSQYAVNLARKDYYPDFRVGYMYQQRPNMPDMHGFTFGINIPIFYKTKQRQAENEAASSLAGNHETREAIRTALFFQVEEQYLQARASDELLTLYSKAIVPQSTLALESGLASYQVGSLDFLSLITSFTSVLDYEINYYDELANYQKALARLEEITGIQLTK